MGENGRETRIARICALLDGVWPPAERVVVKCFRKTYTTECADEVLLQLPPQLNRQLQCYVTVTARVCVNKLFQRPTLCASV